MTQQSASTISARIVAARKAAGLKPGQLARLIGADASQVSRWENKHVPSLTTINKIAKELRVSPAWLTYGVGKGPSVVDDSQIKAAS